METHKQAQLINFLEQDLALPAKSLDMAVRCTEAAVGSLPMVLWQYGLIDLGQLEQVLDWLETA
ncbi:MAG: DUF2949 domain-containing protein [Microcystaceae cyanobacterium]